MNITDTQFFDTLLGDHMKETTYTIFNPWSGQQIMENVPASNLQSMLRYFAWMCGVQVSSLVYKETEISLDATLSSVV